MRGINYGQPFPWGDIEEGETVYMVDFGLQPFSDMEELNNVCELHWIDHHKTAINDAFSVGFLAGGGQLVEEGKAGCELTWEYLHPESPMPRTVFLLGRYDVWDHAADFDVLPFQYGMRNFEDTTPDNIQFWNSAIFFNTDSVANTGRVILDYEAKQNAKFCNAYAFETEFNGMIGVCANRGFTNSKVFDSVYNPVKHHLMITFVRLKPPAGKWTVSIYSTRGDVDCGAIAKTFGGGGHKGAAGFQCDGLPFGI